MKYVVVTKSFLIAAAVIIFMLGFEFVTFHSLVLNWFGVWHKFELWRIITCGVTLGPPSIPVRNRLFFFFKSYIGIY